jgi:hypothetical protein
MILVYGIHDIDRVLVPIDDDNLTCLTLRCTPAGFDDLRSPNPAIQLSWFCSPYLSVTFTASH